MIGSRSAGRKRTSRRSLAVSLVILLGLTVFVAFLGAQAAATPATGETATFKPFAFLDPTSAFTGVERIALFVVLAIAVGGLLYALMLVIPGPQGRPGYQEDAGDRPGRARGGQRLPRRPVQEDRAPYGDHRDPPLFHGLQP